MTFVYTYLVLGFIYAMYIWLFAGDSWWSIPINTLGGPIIFIVELIRGFRTKTRSISSMFSTKKAVIFDLDGTIISSQPLKNKAMENILKSIDAAWVSRNYPHGLNDIEKWDYILKHEKDVDTKFTIKELAEHTKVEYLKLYQDVVPLSGFWPFANYLKNVRNMKIGLATNSDRNVTDTVLKRLGATEVFDFIIAGDEVKHRKPHPEIYRKAIKAMGFKPKEVLVFEDTIVGATAATKAKLDVIVVWDGVEEEREDFPKSVWEFVSNFDGLEGALEKPYAERIAEGVEDMKEVGDSWYE